MKDFKEAIIEGIKEIVRDVILGIIPVIIGSINVETGKIAISMPVLIATSLLIVLRGLDRILHVNGKLNAPKVEEGQSYGLVKL